MQKAIRVRIAGFISALLLLLGNSVWAQQLADRPRQAAMRTLAYDATRETVVEGTVLSYTAESLTPPIGGHLVLQTAAGAIEVHLGAASFLQANHFFVAKGDSVRVVGVSSATRQGTVFLVTLPAMRGTPMSSAAGNGVVRLEARVEAQPSKK